MKNSKIIMWFVGISILIFILVFLSIIILPKFGYEKYLALLFVVHPTVIMFAAFPLVEVYMRKTEEPISYTRAMKLSCIAVLFLLPLSMISESINASALLYSTGTADLVEEGARNYFVFTYRGIALTIIGTLVGLGFVFPAQVKVGQKKKS